jgi:hypothetical protein
MPWEDAEEGDEGSEKRRPEPGPWRWGEGGSGSPIRRGHGPYAEGSPGYRDPWPQQGRRGRVIDVDYPSDSTTGGTAGTSRPLEATGR